MFDFNSITTSMILFIHTKDAVGNWVKGAECLQKYCPSILVSNIFSIILIINMKTEVSLTGTNM